MKEKECEMKKKVKGILKKMDEFHENFEKEHKFSGPSLHFHLRALGLKGKITESEKIELIYSMLSSWGMHRMGKTGARMKDFETFKNSVESVKKEINELKKMNISSLMKEGDKGWEKLEKVFMKIDVMESKPILVSNSKVLAHLLPHLVAPIDREYTLKMINRKSVPQNKEGQWELFKEIHLKFYYPIVRDAKFIKKANKWVRSDKHKWDTSLLKVVDNLVIGMTN